MVEREHLVQCCQYLQEAGVTPTWYVDAESLEDEVWEARA